MPGPKINPLTPADLETMNRVLTTDADIAEFLDACGDCNMDVSSAREQCERQRRFCEAVKRRFFPDNA